MIVSIPETIKHQELERKLFLKKNHSEAENRKIRVIIPRERLQKFIFKFALVEGVLWLVSLHQDRGKKESL